MEDTNDASKARIALNIALIWLAGFGAATQFAKIIVTFGEFPTIYPNNIGALSWMLTAVALMGALFGTVAGVATARIGLKTSLAGALILGGLLSLYEATFPHFPLMILARAMEGFSHLFIVVAAPTLIAKFTPDSIRNWVMTLWAAVFVIAYLITQSMAGLGAHKLLILHGYYMLIVGVICALLVPSVIIKIPAMQDFWSQLRRAYTQPSLIRPAISWFCYACLFISLLAILPPLYPAPTAKFLGFALPIIAMLVNVLLVPLLLMRVSAPLLAVISFGAVAVAAMLMAMLAPNPWPSLLFYAALGAVQGSGFTAAIGLNPTSEARAMLNGLFAQFGNIGNLIATPTLLFVLQSKGALAMSLLIIAVCVLGALSMAKFAKERTRASA